MNQFVSVIMIILDERKAYTQQYEKYLIRNEKLCQHNYSNNISEYTPRTSSSIYIHCLDGRRITGLVILVLRRLQGWAPTAAFSEYWSYQTVMKGVIPIQEIEKSSKEISKFVLEVTHALKFPIGYIFPE